MADLSKAPIYLYDLPVRTRSKIAHETAIELSKHPNIRGIKCSDEPAYTRQLRDSIDNEKFRIIMAQPDLVDVFLRYGLAEHLDGMFAIAPRWIVALGRSAEAGLWDDAAQHQRCISALKGVLVEHGVFPTFTVLMNARGIAGSFAPLPFRPLSGGKRDAVLGTPIVQSLLKS